MPDLLSPTLDFVFKSLFAPSSNKDMLLSLVSAVIRPAVAIRDLIVVNPEVPKRASAMRGLTLDIHAVLDDGRDLDIEMQTVVEAGTHERSLYHWSRLFSEKLGRGQPFTQLRPCVAVFIVARRALPWARFHSTFRVLEIHEHEALCDHLEIHFVELPKLRGHTASHDQADELLRDWCAFFAGDDEAELRRVAERNPMIAKARSELAQLSASKKARYLARRREEWLLLHQYSEAEARRQGVQEGREIGVREGREIGVREGREIGVQEGREIGVREGREIGVQEGLARGLAQGHEAGKRELVLKLLHRRFGASLPDTVVARLSAAPSGELDEWAERVLAVDDLAQLVSELGES